MAAGVLSPRPGSAPVATKCYLETFRFSEDLDFTALRV
jgi:hypothetical protein